MAEIFKFFNSAPGDERWHYASDFADYFGSVLSSGLISNGDSPVGLQVTVNTGTMTTSVNVGRALIKGYSYENTTPLTLTHSIPEQTLDRIDRIVLRLDLKNASRFIRVFIKEGVSALEPVPPELQRDQYIYELSLAQVRIRKNTSSIVVSDIKDERADENLCGIVQSLITVPTSVFQQQFDAWFASIADGTEQSVKDWQIAQQQAFTMWFDSIKGQLDGDVGAKLASDLATHQAEYATFKEAIEADSITFKNHVNNYVKHPGVATTTNSGNDYAVTLDPSPTSYVNAMGLIITVNVDSTGPVTINVNGLGAIPVKKADGSSMKSFKKDGVYTLRYSNSAFILQGEGGDYSDSLVDNVQNAYKSSGIADVALTVNDRIQSKYYGFPNEYTFDLALQSVFFNSISRDGSRLLLGTSSTLYFYKKNPGTKQFIKQVLTIAETNMTKVEFAGDYVVIARTAAPYLKVYKIDAGFTTATPVTIDIQPPVMPGYLSVSSDGKKLLTSPTSNSGVPANMFQLYILQPNGSFAKMGLPDVYPSGSYTYQAAMSKDGTTIALSMGATPYNMVYKINSDGSQTKQVINNPSSYRTDTIPTGTLCSDKGEIFVANWYYSSGSTPGVIIYKKQSNGSYNLVSDISLAGSTGYLDRSITRMDYYKDVLALATATNSRHYFKLKQSDGTLLFMTSMGGSTNATALALFDDVSTPYPVCVWSFNLTSNSVGTDTMGRRVYKFADATLSKLATALDANLIRYVEHIGFALGTVNAGELVDYVGIWGVY